MRRSWPRASWSGSAARRRSCTTAAGERQARRQGGQDRLGPQPHRGHEDHPGRPGRSGTRRHQQHRRDRRRGPSRRPRRREDLPAVPDRRQRPGRHPRERRTGPAAQSAQPHGHRGGDGRHARRCRNVAVFDTAFLATLPPQGLPLRRARRVVQQVPRPQVRLPRHQPPLRHAAGGRAAGQEPDERQPHHRAPGQRLLDDGRRRRQGRRPLHGHDAAGRAGHGHAQRRHRPGRASST